MELEKSQTKFKQTEIGRIPEDWEEVKRNRGYFYFNFKQKKKKIKFIELPKTPFVSNGGLKGIKVDKLFFEKFNKKEKIAILWHEFYHCRKSYISKILWLEIKYYLGNKEAFWEEEYNADKYSAIENNIEDCLSYLKVCKFLYENKIIKCNKKLHPAIDERIKRIENLKKYG